MIFLIHYDRKEGTLHSITEFSSGDRDLAARARLDLEIALMKEDLEREVVLLEADDLAALRSTHARYFRAAGELAVRAKGRSESDLVPIKKEALTRR